MVLHLQARSLWSKVLRIDWRLILVSTHFFTTFSEQFRHVTYITMYMGIVENSGKMLVTFHHRLCELVAMSRLQPECSCCDA